MTLCELGTELAPLTRDDLQRVYGAGWFIRLRNRAYCPAEKVFETNYTVPFDNKTPPGRNGIYVLPQYEEFPAYVGNGCGICQYKVRMLSGGCTPGSGLCRPTFDARAQQHVTRLQERTRIYAGFDVDENGAIHSKYAARTDPHYVNARYANWPDEVPLLCASSKLWASALDPNRDGRLQQAAYLKPEKAYHTVTIPKANGKSRRLHIPCGPLRELQSRILERTLNRCIWPEHVAAYVPGVQLLDTAVKHAGKPIVITLDLKNFFGSTTYSMVYDALVCTYGYLQLGVLPRVADEQLGGMPPLVQQAKLAADGEIYQDTETREAAKAAVLYLADAVTCPVDLNKKNSPRVLPQGAPTSGAFANLVAVHRLDPRVLRVCEQWGVTYSRYADDLIFSRDTDLTREETTQFVDAVVKAVFDSGYRVNWDKLRVQRRNRQQRVLGLVVNDGTPRVPRKTRLQLRAQHHFASQHGLEAAALRNLPADQELDGVTPSEAFRRQHEGRTAYVRHIHADNVRGILNLTPSEWLAQQ